MSQKESFWGKLKDRAVRAMQLFNLSHAIEDGTADRQDFESFGS